MSSSTRRIEVMHREDQQSAGDLRHLTPAERIRMVWPLTREAYTFKEGNLAESRLQRHIVRILRREG